MPLGLALFRLFRPSKPTQRTFFAWSFPMAEQSNAQTNIHFSQQADGAPLAPWVSVRSFSATKECALCKKPFSPWVKVLEDGTRRVMKEKLWLKQPCCSQSCAKKLKNPMSNHQSRLKMRARLREIKHRPIKRGGNGQLLSLPQLALLHALGEGWESEFPVALGKPRQEGLPTCYKLDLANPQLKIGIEVDGASHATIERREQDARKISTLSALGWCVYRVSNARALELFSTFKSVDILLTSLAGN